MAFNGEKIGGCIVIGHRGAMGYAPENTLASFELALKMGVDAVECDVHLSREGTVIVIHDDSVNRTTTGTGFIQDLTVREIKRFDAGAWFNKRFRGEKIPTLKNLLGWARKRITRNGLPLGVIIEIKKESTEHPKIPRRVTEVIQLEHMRERVVVISFDRGVLYQMKQLDSTIKTGILYRNPIPNPIYSARRRPDAIFPRRQLVCRSLVKRAHKTHLKVFTWTVNHPHEMKNLIACGVDGIASNFPDRLYQVVNNA